MNIKNNAKLIFIIYFPKLNIKNNPKIIFIFIKNPKIKFVKK